MAGAKEGLDRRRRGVLNLMTDGAEVAQSVEQRTENPRVTGSIPVLGILSNLLFFSILLRV